MRAAATMQTSPSDLLGISDPYEALVVNVRCVLSHRLDRAEYAADVRRKGGWIFLTEDLGLMG